MSLFRQITYFLTLLCFVMCKSEEDDKWTRQLTEIKMSLFTLGSKLSAVENKIGELQVLDFAFKVTKTDGYIRELDANVRQMKEQLNDVTDVVKNSCKNNKDFEILPTNKPSLERFSSNAVSNDDLMDKIDDYGQKSIVTNQELLQLVDDQQQELVKTNDIIRSGFNKLYDKVDEVLSLEGQFTVVVQTTNGITPRLTQISRQLSDMDDIIQKVQRNEKKLMNLSSSTDVRNVEVVNQAFRIADDSKDNVKKLEALDKNVSDAAEMAKRIWRNFEEKLYINEDIQEDLKALSEKLQNLEEIALPLFFSVPYNFNSIYELLRSAASNESTCDFQPIYRSELLQIKDLIKNSITKPQENPSEFAVGDITRQLSYIQKRANQVDLVDKLNFVKNSISTIKNDLSTTLRGCDQRLISQ